MDRDDLLEALRPALRSAGLLLQMSTDNNDVPARAARCLFAISMMAAHDPPALVIVDNILSREDR